MTPDVWNKVASELSLKTTLKEFRGEFAVLILEKGGHEMLWPKQYLPADAKVGDSIPLSVAGSAMSDEDKAQIARKILEELVN